MKKITNRTAELVKTLQNQIISGIMKPGQKMLPVREIALSYGVSRSVVNSAISALSASGYLRVFPRHFILVEDFLHSGSLNVLEDIFHSDNSELKAKMIKDVLSCRLMVESHSVQAILHQPDLDLSPLEKILLDEKKWLSDSNHSATELPQMDLAFHDTLIRLGDNLASALIYRSFHYLAVPMVQLFYQTPEVAGFVFEKHSHIVSTLIRGDADAALGLLRELLEHGERRVLGLMGEGSGWNGF